MSTDQKARGKGRWLAPALLALPFLAAIAFAAVKVGPLVLDLISVAIKGTVVR